MKSKKKIIMSSILILMMVTIVGIVGYYWYNSTHFVSTDDAKLNADLLKVSPQISGKLLEFSVEEGDKVNKDQIIGRQDIAGQTSDTLENAIIRSPIDGIIIKKQANVGEMCTAGQTLAYVINQDDIYVTANIEETKLTKLRSGEKVDITIDKYKNKKFTGKIDSIGEASAATFSLLPTSTSANFTKVVQKVPVKIKLDKYSNVKLLPGINVVVNIHIK
ncbi:hemolysin D [Clostridium carboxidivorans P7]|uniref:EmrA-related transporter protein n=1 Tax=Clostridium carboxidivorans P7 TaxID=536227 RepID=C6PQF2_9CLOT|nr:efflux RND transporter periplasmic adaptor subunit [Clostridium carboxidivorans]AKN30454.1 hemolysin D [Clostridium carboxidivorans P7]EET88474.1 EmrA-related transporter protein [Clostridium carboxidivorans P7]EFG86195.1 multidrug efflux MFS membrane fusion family protein [Clostridium carboxidivorans P7]